MTAREKKTTEKQHAGRRIAGSQAANGAVHNALQDTDVLRMATAQIEARKAEHHARIAGAAYYRAMQRGFDPGHELEDWLAAEAEVSSSRLLTQIAPATSATMGSSV